MDEDVRLMLAFRDGDQAAFDTLFERWAGRLLHFLERMVRNTAVAEELVQETFLRVHRAREGYQPQARFSTWLFTIGANAARNELRRPYRRAVHQGSDPESGGPLLQLVSPEPPSDEVVDARRLSQRVAEALEELPERQRAALWLCAVEGLSYAEVAEALEATEKSVKALVHRARVGLARTLPSTEAADAEPGAMQRTGAAK